MAATDLTQISTEIGINTTLNANQSGPDISPLSGGGFVAVWRNDGDTSSADSNSIFARVYDADGQAATSEFRVSGQLVSDYTESDPKVTALADGNFAVVWHGVVNFNDFTQVDEIFVRVFDSSGAPVTDEFRVPAQPDTTFNTTNQVFPEVITLNDGNFLVSWASNHNSASQVTYTQVYSPAGNLVGDVQSVQDTSVGSNDHDTAALAGGGHVVAWLGREGTQWGVRVRRFDENGNALGGEMFANSELTGGIDQSSVEVVGLPNGGFVVGWLNNDGTAPFFLETRARLFDADGNPVGNDIEFYPEGDLGGNGVAITPHGDGAFLIGTAMEDPANAGFSDFFGRSFSSTTGEALSDIFALPGDTLGTEQEGVLTTLPNGTIVAAWQEFNGSPDALDVFAQLLGADTATGGPGPDTLVGGDGPDTLSGAGGDDVLSGGVGDDSLDGGDGNDIIAAATGNDVANGGAGDDNMGGGLGDDTMDGGTGNDTLGGGQGDDSASGGDGNDVVNGGAGNDTLSGDLGDDTMGAGFNSDSVDGGDGADSLGGGTGRDTLNGGAGDDAIGGGEGDDIVNGDDGNDFLAGGGRNDVITGGDGDDRINGGDGDDTVTGGAGADLFIFNFFKDGDADVFTDFEDGIDRFRMTGVEGSGAAGKLASLNIVDTVDGALMTLNGHTILVENTLASDLGTEDFVFL